MFRRHQNRRLRGSSSSLRKSKGRDGRFLSRRRFSVERLEERCMLSASQPLMAFFPEVNSSGPGGGTALPPVVPQGPAPFDLSETFLLHSHPGAANVIFLDFDGHITRETAWNQPNMQNPNGVPNIVTPSISATGIFSDNEKAWVQRVWRAWRKTSCRSMWT